MPADVAVSVVVLVGIVALSSVTRRLSTRALADTGVSEYAAEFVSTFQLCCCAHELKVLSEVGRIDPRLALTFTYLITVIHGFTFNGAIGNPTGVLECAYRSRLTRGRAFRRIACEFAAAAASRAAGPLIWGVGLSGIHVRHKLHDFQCISPVHAPLPQAAAVEFACAFAVQTVITYTRSIGGRSHVHAVAAIITTVVYAGGGVTGAVFNPAVAFSTQFPCSGNSFLEYSLVYWLGPIMGMMSSVLLFDKVQRKSSLHVTKETKKRT